MQTYTISTLCIVSS